MADYIGQNKKAWEFCAYDFWTQQCKPEERAKADRANPIGQLKKYANYFEQYEGIKVANICGSCGKKAIPLAILGADVTVFDISEDNKHYALEVAEAANVNIDYQVCDVLAIDMDKYANRFDVVFMEGGILHYFHDIDEFMKIMNFLLRKGGKIICSDFHPFSKITDTHVAQQSTKDYFSTDIFEGEVAHAFYFSEEFRKQIPLCSYRKYTISEIINSVIKCRFIMQQFDEYPDYNNPKIPGEFVLVATK